MDFFFSNVSPSSGTSTTQPPPLDLLIGKYACYLLLYAHVFQRSNHSLDASSANGIGELSLGPLENQSFFVSAVTDGGEAGPH